MKGRKESKGEKRIRLFLESAGIEYISEMKFDMKVNKPIPFDFYLPNHNICIEYNGRQHYEKTLFSRYDLKKRQKNDQIRVNYCKKMGILLIVIGYWQYNSIENILTNILSQLPVIGRF